MTKVALFDLDGTLLDSRPAVLDAYALAAAEFPGGSAALSLIPEGRLLAMRVIEVCAEIAGPADADRCAQLYDENYRLHAPNQVKLYDGVVETLKTLLDEGFDLGIVTNKGRSRTPSDIAPLDGGGGGASLFKVVVTADDTPERKPSSIPMEFALREGGWSPNEVVYVGDGPHDAESALSAGLNFVGAAWGYYGEQSLREGGATLINGDVRDLLETLRTVFSKTPK